MGAKIEVLGTQAHVDPEPITIIANRPILKHSEALRI